jgi:murein DD-endopeptidase MepM/ murein hydrolase activator NlpD
VAGQKVKVGDIIGKVGNTGRSYGAHMHFELIVDGSTIDPQPWLYENAGRYDGVSPVS